MATLLLGKQAASCELIAFDKDGTLIDFHLFWAARVKKGVEDIQFRLAQHNQLRLPALPEAIYHVVGFQIEQGRFLGDGLMAMGTNADIAPAVAAVLGDYGLPMQTARKLVNDAFMPPLVASPEAQYLRTFDDLPALFDSLHAAGIQVGVITNDDRAITEETLEVLDLSGRVDAVICGDDAIPSKPSPEPILHMCRRFGLAPEQAVVVGDTLSDLRMARSAGVGASVGVLSGAGVRQDLAPYADVLLDSIEEIRLAG